MLLILPLSVLIYLACRLPLLNFLLNLVPTLDVDEMKYFKKYGEHIYCSLETFKMISQVNRMKLLFPEAEIDFMIGPCPGILKETEIK